MIYFQTGGRLGACLEWQSSGAAKYGGNLSFGGFKYQTYIYRKLELNKDSPKATKTVWCILWPLRTFFQFRNPGFTKWSGIAIPDGDLCTLVILCLQKLDSKFTADCNWCLRNLPHLNPVIYGTIIYCFVRNNYNQKPQRSLPELLFI